MGMQPKALGTLSEKCCNQSQHLWFIIINGQSQQVEATTSERILAQTALQSHACSFTKLRKLPLKAGAEPKARKPQVEVFNLKPELTPEASI